VPADRNRPRGAGSMGCRLREHARAAAEGQVVKIKDGIVNLQAFIMIRRASEPGFAPLVLASPRHDRGKRARRPFLDRRGNFRS
jgi:hypothetical protein